MITFACFAPHPPLLLPEVGSAKDRAKVKKTIESLERLSEEFKKARPDQIIISSPHPDWGFNVPLHFLAPNFKGKIERLTTGPEPPSFYFEEGKSFCFEKGLHLAKGKMSALIASGDLSHRLKEEGPYRFHPDGPKFDQKLIKLLKKRDIKNFLKLDEMFPEAGECGLRSFSFLLGILGESKIDWKPEILSYEGPFGVGYLVVNFALDTGENAIPQENIERR